MDFGLHAAMIDTNRSIADLSRDISGWFICHDLSGERPANRRCIA